MPGLRTKHYRHSTRVRARAITALVAILLITGVAALAGGPRDASAHDSNSPENAGHNWLPREGWVFQHWIPYDEQTLLSELGITRKELWCWLEADHRTIAGLARRLDRSPERLLHRLMAPWRGKVSDARFGELRSRAHRTLTQGHLGQHVFFHFFHGIGIPARAPALFGVTSEEFIRLRKHDGLTPLQIGARNGRDPARTRARIVALLERNAARAVSTRSSPPRQARRMLRLQLGDLDRWLTRPRPPHDVDSLFDRWGGNGPHERGDAGAPALLCHVPRR